MEAFQDAVAEALAAGDSLTLTGLGTFAVSERAAREGRNPKSGEKMAIAANKSVKFKHGKLLRDSLN